MRSIGLGLAASALLLLSPSALRAEDAPASPAERAAKVLASMPAPSEKDALNLTIDVLSHGSKIGQGTIVAKPAKEDDKPVWSVEEKLTIEVGPPKKMFDESAATLGQDLRVVRGTGHEFMEGEDGETKTVKRTEKGFDIVSKGAAGEKTVTVDAQDGALGTIAGLLLFVSHCPAEPAVYEVTTLEKDKGIVQASTVDVKGPGKFDEGETSLDAWIAHVSSGENEVDIFLTPSDRQFLAIRLVKPSIVMAKSGLVKPPSVPDFSKPTASATECGSRLAVGILTSDEAMIEGVIHWPSVLEESKKSGFAGDEAAIKQTVMSNFKKNFKTMKREQAWPAVKAAADGAKETLADDVTKVKFGAPMGFGYAAKQIDGAWYIVHFDS